jgi:hypothetical protein
MRDGKKVTVLEMSGRRGYIEIEAGNETQHAHIFA